MGQICIILITICFFILKSFGQPQDLNKNNNIAICTEEGEQMIHQILEDGEGGAYVVWEDKRKEGVKAIFAQHTDKEGLTQWGINGMQINTSNRHCYNPKLIRDGASVIVSWLEKTGVYNNQIKVQKLSITGELLWDSLGVDISINNGFKDKINIDMDEMGNFFIVWQEDRGKETKNINQIFAQKLNKEGNLKWGSEPLLISDNSQNCVSPQIISDNEEGSIIVWENVSKKKIQLLSIYPNGELAKEFKSWKITTNDKSIQKNPVLKKNNEQFYLVWEGFNKKLKERNIFIQCYNFYAQQQWGTFPLVLCDEVNDQYSPNINVDKFGNIFIVWLDRRSNKKKAEIYAQKIDSRGNIKWRDNGNLLAKSNHYIGGHRVINDQKGGIIITWEDKLDGNIERIFTQKINASGQPEWVIGGLLISNNEKPKQTPLIASNNENGAIIAWYDERNGQGDIYAQYLDYQGKFYGIDFGKVSDKAKLEIKQDPNTFKSTIELSFPELKKGQEYSFYLYNNYAEEVAFLENIKVKKISLTLDNLAKGEYTYNIKLNNQIIKIEKINH